MVFIKAFIVGGIICVLTQILMDICGLLESIYGHTDLCNLYGFGFENTNLESQFKPFLKWFEKPHHFYNFFPALL